MVPGIPAVERASRPSQRAIVGVIALLVPCLPACVFDLASVVAGAGGGGGGGGCASAGALLDAKNLTKNPSFEADSSGWEGNAAGLSFVDRADAPHGHGVARVTYDASGDSSFSINDAVDTVDAAAVAGATYRASAWVRSAIDPPNPEATVSIILKSKDDDADLAVAQKIKLGPCFTRIETSGLSKHDGDSIGVHVSQYQPAAGDAFDIDLIEVTRELP